MRLWKKRDTAGPNLMGVFAYLDDFVSALQTMRDKNITIRDVYSPTPRHEIDAVLRSKTSPVGYFTLTGALLGILAGIGLVVFTSLQWKLMVSGKPIVPKVPTVIVAFELCILLSILFTMAGMLIKARMPRFRIPVHYDPRFTEDRFGVLVAFPEGKRDEVERILREAGAEEIHDVNG